jgi:hypothetical protein
MSGGREATTAPDGAEFVHHAALYGSDDAFVAMALPFLTGGLAAGEPVLAVTTSANLELLRDALGERADAVDYAESAYFGRRPPHRVTAFERYRRGHAAARRVRILAEPVWAGRSPAEVADWTRMESGLNTLLAGTGIVMICPYDTRVVPADIAADARRTHPTHIAGDQVTGCPEFVDPAEFAAAPGPPWPEPPADAARLPDAPGSRAVRRFTAARARGYGLPDGPAAMLVMAVSEVAGHLRTRVGGPVTVRIWARPGAIVCDLQVPAAADLGPFPGYRSPVAGRPGPNDGLWYARQVCDLVEIRAAGRGTRARLHFPTRRAAELAESGRAYLS